MNLIELHILQSFPVTCLNRDDVGAPKTAMFGGCQRARVSSQCWKRAIRTLAKDYAPESFGGIRTRFVVRKLTGLFTERGYDDTQSKLLAERIADAMGKLDNPEKGNVKTLLFFTPLELDAVVNTMAESADDKLVAAAASEETGKKERETAIKELEKIAAKSVKGLKSKVRDMADIAIFGRMVADDSSLTLEGAGLFSHALSTHTVANEVDFFSAIDDLNTDDAGAGHIGVIEFNAACYYRYIGLNLDLLRDGDHLGHFGEEELDDIIRSFVRASLLAVPSARKNSQFGHNPPAYVLGLRREGQPLSLINAFESPVRSTGGYVTASITALKSHWESLKSLYALTAAEIELPPATIADFLSGLTGGMRS